MTPATLNSTLRKAFPASHRWVRRAAKSLLMDHATVLQWLPAVPRKLESERVWVHPRFFATPLDVEAHVRRWLHDYLAPGKTFFDVGAYAGWHSLYAARLVGPQGRVIAFEASPANARCLEYHRKKNGLPQMKVISAAVADRPSGEMTFHLLNGGDSTSNSIQCGKAYTDSQAHQNLSRVTVPVTNLDAYADRFTPDLIKIDVEGAELLALRGAAKIMATRRPPILLAVHPSWLPDGEKAEQIVELLNQRGYDIFDAEMNPPEALEFADYLCLPDERSPLD